MIVVKTKFSVFGIFSFINAAASRLIRWFCLKKIICDSEIIPNLMKDLLEARFRIYSQNINRRQLKRTFFLNLNLYVGSFADFGDLFFTILFFGNKIWDEHCLRFVYLYWLSSSSKSDSISLCNVSTKSRIRFRRPDLKGQ